MNKECIVKNYLYFDGDDITKKEQTISFISETDMPFKKESNVVVLYPDFTYQTMGGFGCALTETACYLLSEMEPEVRLDLLKKWFSKEGMDAAYIRISMDSCDYSLSEYQAVEDPIADPELTTFSLKRDRKYVLPIVKEALQVSSRPLSVLLSPWSPPAQWKERIDGSKNDAGVYGGEETSAEVISERIGGRLQKKYYTSWAKYLVKYIQAYLNEGIPVTMLTLQNETSAETNWDSCVWTGAEMNEFLKHHFYPEFTKARLNGKVKIFIWDHNKERVVEHALEVIDEETTDMVDGIAIHWYSGDHFEALSLLKERWPDKFLLHSESCGLHLPGCPMMFDITALPIEEVLKHVPEQYHDLLKKDPKTVDMEDAINYAHDIIGDFNNGLQGYIDWNLVVNEKGGPRHVDGGFTAPILTTKPNTYELTPSYHTLKALSEVLCPGSVRIGKSTFCRDIEACAAIHPDGRIGVGLLNWSEKEMPVSIRISGKIADLELPAKSLNTLFV